MEEQNPQFKFVRREREVLELFYRGYSPKRIADALELSVSAVNAKLNQACEKAAVSRSEIIIYLLQQPDALVRGGKCTPRLHPAACACESTYCQVSVRTYRDYAVATMRPAMQS